MEKELWQNELIDTVRSIKELCKLLDISYSKLLPKLNTTPTFPINIPRFFINKMKKRDLKDPLLLQVLPQKSEKTTNEYYLKDPVGDEKALTNNLLIHKYKNRVLLLTNGNCAIHCRYCFRQHFPYHTASYTKTIFQDMLQEIKNNTDINEVILSGGDPLTLPNETLDNIIQGVSEIPHIQTVRFHTRIPIVLKNRITEDLIYRLIKHTLKYVFVLHINHPNEIDIHLANDVKRLKKENITVLNQSVLLKGINDNIEVLKNLSTKLFHSGVLPYYINQLDRVHGSRHFEISTDDGIRLINRLKKELSGYLVPRFVKDNIKEPNKVLIC